MQTRLSRLLVACIGLAGAALPVSLSAAEAVRPAASIAVHVTEAAQRFAIPEAWIYAVMQVESAGAMRAVSPKGAAGLMQIMPGTWTYLRARYGLAENVYDPRANILAGTAYMRELYDRYGAPGFLAAYNAGPARYEAYLNAGRPLPRETVAYLAKLALITGGVVATIMAAPRLDRFAWTRSAVFVNSSRNASVSRRTGSVDPAPNSADVASGERQPPSLGLFVSLSGQHPR